MFEFDPQVLMCALILTSGLPVLPMALHRKTDMRSLRRYRLPSRFRVNQSGFSLIEILSVMVIMSTLISVSVNKFDLLSDSAYLTALKTGTRELNTREIMEWTKVKLSDPGWSTDIEVFNAVDKRLGPGYDWNTGPSISGGVLRYKSQSADLDRNASTGKTAGSWK